nr:immunoglobulin heavy chain junction region [Macaca mulatta]
CARWASADFD